MKLVVPSRKVHHPQHPGVGLGRGIVPGIFLGQNGVAVVLAGDYPQYGGLAKAVHFGHKIKELFLLSSVP
ncbi:hypothetical protein DFAR_920014 [Desulfarculales bacterium]